VFGTEDIRSRIEPMTDAFAEFLPAVDVIFPNEIDPIAAPDYFYLY
jgi:hypothetical protein